LETIVSYRDVPLLKDLLLIQKKFRSIIDEWLMYCRTCLAVMPPDKYLISFMSSRQGVQGHHLTSSRLDNKHENYNKIIIFNCKSKSSSEFKESLQKSKQNEVKRIDFDDSRSKSAFMGIYSNLFSFNY
jgi:hypothetical protein